MVHVIENQATRIKLKRAPEQLGDAPDAVLTDLINIVLPVSGRLELRHGISYQCGIEEVIYALRSAGLNDAAQWLEDYSRDSGSDLLAINPGCYEILPTIRTRKTC